MQKGKTVIEEQDDDGSVQMPGYDQLMERLIAALNAEYVIEKIYPAICDALGDERMLPLGIVGAITTAHENVRGRTSWMAVERYIRAITPPEILQETLDAWASIRAKTTWAM
jgi:hypothetical protein